MITLDQNAAAVKMRAVQARKTHHRATVKQDFAKGGQNPRRARHAARNVLRTESSLRRVRNCGSCAGSLVAVKMKDSKAGYGGLQSCGSTWACPVCSFKIAAGRAEEVKTALELWDKRRKGRVVFVTLTMRHNKRQKLEDLWDNLSFAWNRVTSGRGWKRDALHHGMTLPRTIKTGARAGQTVHEDRIHYIRAVETTHGAKNGWHVHIHTILFVSGGSTEGSAKALGDSMFARWAVALSDRGMTAPSPEHGIDVKLVERGDQDALAKYFSKSIYASGKNGIAGAGWEITGGASKKARGENRTPFQILEDVVTLGDEADLRLWREWERVSHGRRQLTWSVGLRLELNLSKEMSDQDHADKDMLHGKVVMLFDKEQWSVLRWSSAEVLEMVEAGRRYVEICEEFGLPPTRHAPE